MLPEINTSSTAFLAGLITSLHCVGMCGPLACLVLPRHQEEGTWLTVGSLYHLGRLCSYGLLGLLAGGFGGLATGLLEAKVLRYLPWLLVPFFFALAFNWERYLPKLAGSSAWTLRLHGWLRARTPPQAAALLGFATPLLPCGPLYFAFAACLLAGSALRGLEFMLAFVLGTIPLLWLAQAQVHRLRTAFSPLWRQRLRLAFALLAAGLVAWRLRSTLGFEGPSLTNFLCAG